MSTLERQVAMARRRLLTNSFLHWLTLGLLVAAGVWALAVLVDRCFALEMPLWSIAGGAAVLALFIGLTGMMRSGIDPLLSAVTLDQRSGMKERLSTALLVSGMEDEFARAAYRDGLEAAGRIHVPSQIPVRNPPWTPWSFAGLTVAALVFWLMPPLNLLSADPTPSMESRDALRQEQQTINEELKAKMARIEQLTESNPALKDLEIDLEPLEMPETPDLTQEDLRREALKKIDRLNDKLESQMDVEMKEQVDAFKRMMAQLSPSTGTDPVSKLSRSLAEGNLQNAQEALKDLKDKLEEAEKSDDPETRKTAQKMQDQLKRLSQQMDKLDAQKQMAMELQKRAGMSGEDAKKLMEQLSKMDPNELAKQLQQQLAQQGMDQQQAQQLAQKIQKQAQAQQSCQNMAQSLAQAAQSLAQQQGQQSSDGSGGQASSASALSDAMNQLSQMEMNEQMMNELEAQIADLNNLRDNVGQGACQNPGFGNRDGQPMDPNSVGGQGPQYGLGYGSRIGAERVAHDFSPTKANTRVTDGEIIGKMMVDVSQLKGEAAAQVRDVVLSAKAEAENEVAQNKIPRLYHKAMKGYFDRTAQLADKAE